MASEHIRDIRAYNWVSQSSSLVAPPFLVWTWWKIDDGGLRDRRGAARDEARGTGSTTGTRRALFLVLGFSRVTELTGGLSVLRELFR